MGVSSRDDRAVRITFGELDSVVQARLWQKYGREKALEMFISYLRTAVFLGVEVVMTRSQILDGIILLELGPDGLRRALGFEQYERLPLHVLLSPEEYEKSQKCSRKEGIALSVQKVREFSLSSAKVAVGCSEANDEECSWFYEVTPLSEGIDEEKLSRLDRKISAWQEALCSEDISIGPWGGKDADQEIDNREEKKRKLKDYLILPQGIKPEYAEILNKIRTRESDRQEVLKNIAAECKHFEHCQVGDREAFQRALADWWDFGYQQKINLGNGCKTLRFLPIEPDRYGKEGSDSYRLAESLGLVGNKRSRWQLLWSRLGFGKGNQGGILRIEGEITENFKKYVPCNFRTLLIGIGNLADRYWREPSGRTMFDLALAVREHSTSITPRSKKWPQMLARIVLLIVIAFVFALHDFVPEVFGTWGRSIALWVALAVLVGMPWGEMLAFFSYRPSKMVATIHVEPDMREVRKDEQ